MIRARHVAAGLAAALAVAASTAWTANGMRRFVWENRPLVVIAPGPDHPDLRRQQRIAESHRAGFRDRDMVVIAITEGEVTVDREPAPDLDAASLRERFEVPPAAFRALLVGKDGTVKLRAERPISAERLFERIDAMPMRQREMREDSRG